MKAALSFFIVLLVITPFIGCPRTTLQISPSPSPAPATISPITAASIPALYSSIYTNLKTTLDSFSDYLDGQGEPQNATIFGAELLPANCNRGEDLLKPTVLPSVKLYLDRLQALGVQGVTIAIHYPLYSPEFPRFTEYVSFYKQVVNEVRARGMKLDVESHVIFANTPFSSITWDYSKLTFDEYKTARRELITRIIDDLHPDFLNVGAEPDTEATLLGMKELLDPAKYTEYIAYLVDGLPRGDTKVVAGMGSWGNIEYARNLASLNSLDGLSLHVYPIVGKSLGQMVQIAQIAKSNSKSLVFDECWLSKTDVLVSNGVVSSPEIFRRDAYSFWATLDQEFLTLMVKFSRLYGVSYLSPFWSEFFFAYLNYSPDISGLSYAETAALEAQAEYTNIQSGTISTTGIKYKELILQNN